MPGTRLTFGCAHCGRTLAGQLTFPELPALLAPGLALMLRKAGIPVKDATGDLTAMLAQVPPDMIGRALDARCGDCLLDSLSPKPLSQGSPHGNDGNASPGQSAGG